jgi:hypothetical protein
MADYPQTIAKVLARSRADATSDLLIGAAFLVVNIAVFRAHGWLLYTIATLFGLQTLFAIRRRFRLRASSPIVAALVEPSKLARVRGWPYLKAMPPGKLPHFVLAIGKDGSRVRLKLGDKNIKAFVDAVAEAAPALDIDVGNVLVRAA